MLTKQHKLALYMEGHLGGMYGKMGNGILRYSPNPIVAIIDSTAVGKSVSELTGIASDVPIVSTVDQAKKLGAEVLVLAIAPSGGAMPTEWYSALDEAVEKGLSLVNGLHDLLTPRYPVLRQGQFVWDIRVEPPGLEIGRGLAAELPNKRVLMIGTDMAIGKMTAGLEIYKLALDQGVKASFVATGQIGITLTGAGVPLDAIRVDYASGAIEREVMHAKDSELVIIEGQGSLINPSSTANMALLRGSCPTHLVLCHKAGMETLQKFPQIKIPPLADFLMLYEDLATACGVFARPKTAGVCLNTSHLSASDAKAACEHLEEELGIPVADPVRAAPERILEAILG